MSGRIAGFASKRKTGAYPAKRPPPHLITTKYLYPAAGANLKTDPVYLFQIKCAPTESIR